MQLSTHGFFVFGVSTRFQDVDDARSVELWSIISKDAFFVNVRPTSGEEHGVVTNASLSKSFATNGCRGSRSSEVPLFHANQSRARVSLQEGSRVQRISARCASAVSQRHSRNVARHTAAVVLCDVSTPEMFSTREEMVNFALKFR